ncbi:PEP/pyruvate-binding domain-containing protein, partial [bacterium]|nr:PEP/pyruvate-binding domain-containing protein [bacterium]
MFSTPGNKIGENHVPYVFHVDDIAGDYISEVHLGRKGVSLSNLHSFDVPVPEFFVISPKVFTDFVKRVFEEKKDELLRDENPEPREISNLFQRFDFDNQVKSELLREYTKLSGFSDAWVSVRSSVCYNLSKEVSFSDVFATELNVRGFNNVIRSIKNIYASLFTDEAVMYAVREGVELSDVSLAVVIQKMVHSEISGTCFTVDPVTLSTAQMSMEAVFGLGDVIANGEITPDTYYLHKKNLEVYEKHISP